MAKSRPNREPEAAELFENTAPKVRMRVKEKGQSVRVRSGPGIDHSQVSGEYLGDGEYDIVEVSEGTGSRSGWGKLADNRGWVALDFVQRVRRNQSK